jgi:predicted porin
MYGRASANAAAEAVTAGDSTYYALGYDHALSKRTSLYTTLASINNNKAARFSVNGTGTGADRPIAGGTSRGMEVGIRHNF